MGLSRQGMILCIVLAFFGLNLFGQKIPVVDKRVFYKVHSTLFDTFAPYSFYEADTTYRHLLEQAKQQSFERARLVPDLKAAFLLLSNVHLLHNQKLIRSYYRFLAKDRVLGAQASAESLSPMKNFIHNLPHKDTILSIAHLSVSERLQLLALMINSKVNLLRQISFYVRMFYLDAVYSNDVGVKASGIYEERVTQARVLPSIPALKTHLRYNRKKNRLEGNIDVLIAGSGAAASVAGSEFQKAGLQVLLVEKGSFVIPGAIDTTANFRFMENRGPHVSENGSVALVNAETAGGGPTVNIDMSFPPTLPFIRYRFDEWHRKGLIPADLWTHDQMDEAFAWVNEQFHPRTIEADEINANNAMLIRGATELEIPVKPYQLNKYAPDESPHEVYHKKSSLEILLLPSMLDQKNPLTLLTNCRVTEVLMKNNEAQGFDCIYEIRDSGTGIVNDLYGFHIKPKTKIRIFAKNVVLAAGNLGTSGILLRSKIKNKNIGTGFVVHPFVPLMGMFEDEINVHEGEPSTVYIDHFMQTHENPDNPGYLIESGGASFNLGATLNPGNPKQVRDRMSELRNAGGFAVMQTDTPHRKNRVLLGQDGRLKFRYHLLDSDRCNLIEGIKTSVKILFAAGATEVMFNSFEYPLFQHDKIHSNSLTPDMDVDDLFRFFSIVPNQTFLLGAHMMGGNKIGVSPINSVVNSDYQVWNTKGLYVIDSSIFPGSVGANPMQTIYSCAKIFADGFLRGHVAMERISSFRNL